MSVFYFRKDPLAGCRKAAECCTNWSKIQRSGQKGPVIRLRHLANQKCCRPIYFEISFIRRGLLWKTGWGLSATRTSSATLSYPSKSTSNKNKFCPIQTNWHDSPRPPAHLSAHKVPYNYTWTSCCSRGRASCTTWEWAGWARPAWSLVVAARTRCWSSCSAACFRRRGAHFHSSYSTAHCTKL